MQESGQPGDSEHKQSARPLRLFLSYSPADDKLRNELHNHLAALHHEGLITSWFDRLIKPGDERDQKILIHLRDADIILILVSSDFLSSESLLETELAQALRQHREGWSRVIPIIVRTVDWRSSPLGGLEPLPTGGQAVTSWRNRDDAWAHITERIRETAETLRAESRHGSEWTSLTKRTASRAVEPKDEFLDRILRVCRLREEARGHTVECHFSEAPPPFDVVAEVSYSDGYITRIYALAALKEPLTSDNLELFYQRVHKPYEETAPGTISVLVCAGPPPSRELWRQAHGKRIRVQSFNEYQGLIDFRSYLDLQTRKLAEDPIYPHALYVPQQLVYSIGREPHKEEALPRICEWLSSPEGRFILVLGDFGTGKTFLLHELAHKLGRENGPVVPILIEMRNLEKAASLDVLLAQHMALLGVERYDLAAFRYMLSEGRIALLFDGFDELALRVSYERAADHLDTLIQAANGQAKVVVTSRTQHFQSDDQVHTALAKKLDLLPMRRICQLQPFEKPQIRAFLVNLFQEGAAARYELLDEVKDLLGLSANPRMLGFISSISEEDLRRAKEQEGEITSASLYRLLLERWLLHEQDRAHPPGIQQGLSIDERWAAVTRLALRLWQRTERAVSLSELPEEVAAIVENLAERQLDSGTAVHQVGSGTLLSRDQDGNFSFIHQSILEWLVARSAARELQEQKSCTVLEIRELSPLMADFLIALAGKELAAEWARRMAREVASDQAIKNAMHVLGRMGLDAGTRINFSGRKLRGEDLSGRDLRLADLRNADLTEARLRRTNLMGALLNGAKLARADLTEAILTEADLTEADLSFACLIRARMERVILSERTCLRAAKLVYATIDPESLARADTIGAAPPDQWRIEPMFGCRPAACLSAAFSPDGRFLASGWANQMVRIHEVATGQELRVLSGHSASVRSVAFSTDSRLLVTSSEDRTARIWEFSSGRIRHILSGHPEALRSAAIDAEGRYVATGCDDGGVRLWDVRTGKLFRELTGTSAQPITGVAFDPVDPNQLASCSQNGRVCLWDVRSGQLLNADFSDPSRKLALAFNVSGTMLAVATPTAVVTLTNPGWHRTQRDVLDRLSGGLCFRSTDVRVMAGSLNDVLDVSVRPNAPAAHESQVSWSKHSAPVNCVAVSPDGRLLASGSDDQTLCLWDLPANRQLRRIEGAGTPFGHLSFHPDSESLFLADEVGMVRTWQIPDRSALNLGHVGGSDPLVGIAISADGESLAWVAKDSVQVSSMTSGSLHSSYGVSEAAARCLAFSPNGAFLAIGTESQVRVLAPGISRRFREFFSADAESIECLTFGWRAHLLVGGSLDGSIAIWDLQKQERLRTLLGHHGYILSVAVNEDGTLLASRSADKTLRVWNLLDGDPLFIVGGTGARPGNIAFSPNGALLATPGEDASVILLDVSSGEVKWRLIGHAAPVRSVAFSPNGRWLASTGDDLTVRLWDVQTGEQDQGLYCTDHGYVIFDPNGRCHPSGDLGGRFWGAGSLCRFEPDLLGTLFTAGREDGGSKR